MMCMCVCLSVYVMRMSVGLLCCPFVCGMSVFVTLYLDTSPWCLCGSLSVACVSVDLGLYFVCGMCGSL